MTRTARIISESKLYHIIVRGINKQIIFEETDDFLSFLRMARNCTIKYEIQILSYVLMSNHVHIIIRDCNDNISLFMKSLGLRYARYFNNKYDRVGSLFQDRFINIPIMSERQLYSTMTYIIMNPERAGICSYKTYRWSSYYECVTGSRMLIDDRYAQQHANNISECIENENICKEISRHIIPDSEAITIIRETIGENSGTAILKYDKQHRNEVLRELKKRKLSVRQIERLTGINRGIIQRA